MASICLQFEVVGLGQAAQTRTNTELFIDTRATLYILNGGNENEGYLYHHFFLIDENCLSKYLFIIDY